MTLLFDHYAARHLKDRGGYPPESLVVTGSPRLDALMRAMAALTPEAVTAAARDANVAAGEALVLVATKERESRHVLPAVIAAAASIQGAKLVIKAHPAETVAAYDTIAGRHPHVRVLPATASLPELLAASRAVVTVNSTVALDAAVAGIPSLVVGLPNTLSPFVSAGALAGAATVADIGPLLKRILYDEGFRQQLAARRNAFLEANGLTADGGAARRSATAILRLTRVPCMGSERKSN